MHINQQVPTHFCMDRSRNWVFTTHNYTDESITTLDNLTVRYICYGKETCPTTGSPHLQGYVVFPNARRLSTVRELIPGSHLERARGTPAQCITYCEKEGRFYERGDRPRTPTELGDGERSRWALALSSAQSGDFDSIDPQILISHLGNLQRIHDVHMVVLPSLPTTAGVWIYGPSGCGKSRGCRTYFPDLYPKPLNKWWDGYTDQETVLIDDVDPSHYQWIGSFLKIWADHYSFIGESKGRSRPIRPKRLLVTSQYTIEAVFLSLGRELVDALERRFRVIELTRTDDPTSWTEVFNPGMEGPNDGRSP